MAEALLNEMRLQLINMILPHVQMPQSRSDFLNNAFPNDNLRYSINMDGDPHSFASRIVHTLDHYGCDPKLHTQPLSNICQILLRLEGHQNQIELKSIMKHLAEWCAAPAIPLPPSPPQSWTGESPFPGLRTFTPVDAAIFFGRDQEITDLIHLLEHSRFVCLVGASGSGKSSLVGAGVLSHLKQGDIKGSSDWLLPEYEDGGWSRLRFTPGGAENNDPFKALINAIPLTQTLSLPMLEENLRAGTIASLVDALLNDHPLHAKLLLFIDQLEELFTLVKADFRLPFGALLANLARHDRVRIITTIRADFFAQAIELRSLGELVDQNYTLRAPTLDALVDMIVQPAEWAHLNFESGLVGRILRDTGEEPGALPLLAYLLDGLYKRKGLTHTNYDALGGVLGSIGTRADDVFSKLDDEAKQAVPDVFRHLLVVSREGVPTRRRIPLSIVNDNGKNEAADRLVDALTGARLLIKDRGPHDEPEIEVAHEALFHKWTHLETWIKGAKSDLYLEHQVRVSANEWRENNYDPDYLWQHERLQTVYDMMKKRHLDIEKEFDENERAFLRPELDRLLEEVTNPETTTERRGIIANRFLQIGDLNTEFLQETQTLLEPFVETVSERRVLVQQALLGLPILNMFDYSGSPRVFTTNLLYILIASGESGKEALQAILRELRSQTGIDRQEQIDSLITRIDQLTTTEVLKTKSTKTLLPTQFRQLSAIQMRIINTILLQQFSSEAERRAHLYSVFWESDVRSHIDYHGSAMTFVSHLIDTLQNYDVGSDTNALYIFLTSLLEDDYFYIEPDLKVALKEIIDEVYSGTERAQRYLVSGQFDIRYAYNYEGLVELAKGVVCISGPNLKIQQSGFMIANDLLMTASFEVNELAEGLICQFNYQLDRFRNPLPQMFCSVAQQPLFHNNTYLGYCVIQLRPPFPAFTTFKLLAQYREVEEALSIIHHPLGGYKGISTHGRFLGHLNDHRHQYTLPTAPGSAGAPVLNSNFEVIAVHRSESDRPSHPSSGTSMFAILRDLKENAPHIYQKLLDAGTIVL